MPTTRRKALHWPVFVAGVSTLAACGLARSRRVSAAPASTRGLAEVNGTQLYYEQAGAGEPLVLIHGMGGDCRVWDLCLDAFARTHRTVRYDMRGFGRSSAPAEPYSRVEDLLALLDYMGIARVHLVSDSLGGMVALDFALAYPDRALSLVSISGPISGETGLPEPPVEDARAYGAMGSALQQGDLQGAAEHLLGVGYLRVVNADSTARAHLATIFVDYFASHGADQHTLLPLEPPAAARLGQVRVPALYIIGEHDNAQNQARGELFVAGIPGARRVVMAGCDHAPLLTQPEAFGRIVLDFLREHPAACPDRMGRSGPDGIHGGK